MAGYRTIRVKLGSAEAAVYTSPRVAKALEDILTNATLYEGVRIEQILKAVYTQGTKDGALRAFAETDRAMTEAKRHHVPHKKPGRPRRR